MPNLELNYNDTIYTIVAETTEGNFYLNESP